MNILILNWRDPKNPLAGGAEKLNLEILKPFLQAGNSITWYAMASRNLPFQETYQKIHIIRFGNIITHFLALPVFLFFKKFGKVDFIIDSIHGIGYVTPVLAPRTKKLVLICEVAKNIWDEMLPFPINILGKFLEKIIFVLYQNEKILTISHSTAQDLMAHGIKKRNITVLSMGFDIQTYLKNSFKKTKTQTALFVGRLAKMKGIEDAIAAIATVNKQQKKKWQLHVIGRGETTYEEKLHNLVKHLKLRKEVHFLGYVDEKIKAKYMALSWVLLVPSSREGWGMIVPEANALGTQVIGYDVPGLREVLPLYAKENICVSPKYLSLVKALRSIHSPVHIKIRPEPGWGKLHKQVKELISS